MKDKTIELFDELIEQFSEIHNEWEINTLKKLKHEYENTKVKLDWHEEHFNG